MQAVFLVAMRRADRFEDGRALLPWLTGMLRFSLRDLRRRARRSRAREEMVARGTATAPIAPHESEEATLVRSAIERLPTGERDVVRLRHLEGRAVSDVARLLAIPEGTVKTRSKRGLGRLRKALPAGLASGFLLLMSSTSRGHVPGPAVGFAGRNLIVSARSLAVLTCATALTVIGVLITRDRTTVTPPRLSDVPSSGAERTLQSESGEQRSDIRTNRRETGPAGESFSTMAGRARWVLAGVVMRDQSPVSGAEVTVEAWPERPDFPARAVTTDPGGHFAVDLRALASWPALVRSLTTINITAWHPAHGHAALELIEDLPADPDRGFTRKIELVMPSVPRISGRITDAEGQPVADAFVQLEALEPPALPYQSSRTTTDASGRYSLPLPADRSTVLRAGHANLGVASQRLDAPGLPGTTHLQDMALESRGAIQGRVTMRDGAPAAGRVVKVFPATATQERDRAIQERPVAPLRAITDARGQFRIAGLASGVHDVALESLDPRRKSRFAQRIRLRNTAHVRLIDDRPELQVTCLEPEGWPMRGIALRLQNLESDDDPLLIERSNPNGVHHIPLPEGGSYRLTVSAPGTETFEDIIGIPPSGTVRREIVLRPISAAASIFITLRDPDGRPLPTVHVTGFSAGADPFREPPRFELTTPAGLNIPISAGTHRLLIDMEGEREPIEAMSTRLARIDVHLAPGEHRAVNAVLERRARLDLLWPLATPTSSLPPSVEVHVRDRHAPSSPWERITPDLFTLEQAAPQSRSANRKLLPFHWFPPDDRLSNPLDIRMRVGDRERIETLQLRHGQTSRLRLP